jgi:putative ABC transport system permease protein
MWRRKGRTLLTIFGIVVGIFALTVLGGMATRMNQQMGGMKGYVANKIMVESPDVTAGLEPGMSMSGMKFVEMSKIPEIEKVPGVKAVSAIVMTQLKSMQGFSYPQLMIGYQPVAGTSYFQDIKISGGRELQPGDSGKVVLGATLAKDMNARVGKTVTLKGRPFEVVGIMDTTLGLTDGSAFIPFQDVMNLFQAENPYVKTEGIAQALAAFPKPGVDAEALAVQISKSVTGIKTTSPKQSEKQLSNISTIFSAIILGVAFIALFVGGLSVINTMIMSVSERRREIGLKKAIGAPVGTILREYLGEAAMIGLLAGLVGMLLGLLVISILNGATAHDEVVIFTVTATVVAGPVIFGTVLATLAGLFPALRAARLNPVDALKDE